MCGIAGYSGARDAQGVLMDALERLEYRGSESMGLAIVDEGLSVYKKEGRASLLRDSLPSISGSTGIGHTRWAAIGGPSEENAHPLLSNDGRIALASNGLIDNHIELRRKLEGEGYEFSSETDAEVLVHLVDRYMDGDLHRALLRALQDVRGSYAVAAVEEGRDRIVLARKESPLVIGIGVDETFIASDINAMSSYTTDVIRLLDGESAIVSQGKVEIFSPEGKPVQREPHSVSRSKEDRGKAGFDHYMIKEIFDQPGSVRATLLSHLDGLEESDLLRDVRPRDVRIVACGSSYHAGLVGKYVIEELAQVPVSVEVGSEFRYSPRTDGNPLVILISQSGETADTLAACREATRRGSRTLAISNVEGSQLTQEANFSLLTMAGTEISVAATKTFTAQLTALYLVALKLAFNLRTLDEIHLRELKTQFRSLPTIIEQVLERVDRLQPAVEMLLESEHAFFIGRGRCYPCMLEGALKLKEVSYIHAEGYAAGEIKHGPLALLDESTPLIAACLEGPGYDRMLSNVNEVAARGSPVLVLASDGDEEAGSLGDKVIYMPRCPPLLAPVPLTVLLQLIAYQVANARGLPVDQPRNLTKSVTVE